MSMEPTEIDNVILLYLRYHRVSTIIADSTIVIYNTLIAHSIQS